MQKGSKEFIISLLESQERFSPIFTEIKPELKKDKEVKACIFDIYGTLLMSSSGDINTRYVRTKNLKKTFEITGVTINKSFKNERAILFLILDIFKKVISNHHENSRNSSIPYPEIEIREIWEEVLHLASSKEYIYIEEDFDITTFTLVFELVNNKAYPIPGMTDIIDRIKERNMPLGIVSNAQHYTPVIMNYFITGNLNNDESVVHFNEDLQFFSYKYKKAKPDTFLFDLLVPVLHEKYGLQPYETIYIGNDMLKDVLPAKQVGLKTVLFAGDKRSLRLRKDEAKIKGITPDYIITDLIQIFEII